MRGLSLKELALKTNGQISQPTLSRYERGDAEPEGDKLRQIARALDLSFDYFQRKAIEIGPVEFRKRARLGKKEQERIKGLTQDFLERYLEAEFLLDESSKKLPIYPKLIDSFEAAEEAAYYLREKWKLGNNPIHSVVELLEAEDIRVLKVAADDKFDGLSSIPASEEGFIVYNEGLPDKRKPLDRQRFTLLHELGHHYLKIAEGLDEERIVFRFAGAFAMPRAVLEERIGESRKRLHLVELLGLKKEFGISVAALAYRCKDLGIISDYTFQQTMIEITKRGWRKTEPAVFKGEERPTRMLEILGRGLVEECISMGKAAQLYGLKAGEFHTLLYNLGETS